MGTGDWGGPGEPTWGVVLVLRDPQTLSRLGLALRGLSGPSTPLHPLPLGPSPPWATWVEKSGENNSQPWAAGDAGETLGGDLPGRTPLMVEPCASRKSPRCLWGSWRTDLEVLAQERVSPNSPLSCLSLGHLSLGGGALHPGGAVGKKLFSSALEFGEEG